MSLVDVRASASSANVQRQVGSSYLQKPSNKSLSIQLDFGEVEVGRQSWLPVLSGLRMGDRCTYRPRAGLRRVRAWASGGVEPEPNRGTALPDRRGPCGLWRATAADPCEQPTDLAIGSERRLCWRGAPLGYHARAAPRLRGSEISGYPKHPMNEPTHVCKRRQVRKRHCPLCSCSAYPPPGGCAYGNRTME